MSAPVAGWFRRRAALAGVVVVTAGGALQYRQVAQTADFGPGARAAKRDSGPFYLGIQLTHAEASAGPSRLAAVESRLGVSFSIVSIPRAREVEDLDDSLRDLRDVVDRGRIPLITWAPANREEVAALLRGELDERLLAYADRLRDLGAPLLLRFAPGADDPKSPWSSGANTPSEFRTAWGHVYRLFTRRGASNVGWVWTPGSAATPSDYYPGDELVDWIAADLPGDRATALDCERRPFAERYTPFRPRLLAYEKPVLVAALGPAPCEGDRAAWPLEALTEIRSQYPEIGGLVVRDDVPAAPDWSGPRGRAIAAERRGLGSAPARPRTGERRRLLPAGRKQSIRGVPGEYELIVDGRRFYVRGVAYSPDDWREGRLPLSRRRLEQDFAAIRAMGANTVRRYGTGWYDHNVLTVAHEQDLKVLMGFWLAPDVDYLEDPDAVRRYEREVVKSVEALRSYPAVLGWVLGNETWGHLDKRFAPPKLTRVRRAYAELVERLAVRIHEIDPDRPVITALEHAENLPGALTDFARFAPSLDVIGVNSYYEPRLASVSATVEAFDPGRPYLTSEFGPDGYWDSSLSEHQSNGRLWERSGSVKAEQYATAWARFIAPYRGRNIGGIAYCWRERREGTATWFGLTDASDRRKPAYYALRRAWTGEPAAAGPEVLSIQSRGLDEFEAEDVVAFFAEVRSEEPLVYEWSLRRDEFQETGADLEPLHGGRAVRVRLPAEPGVYRLYLHVSDGGARVDTASLALRIAPRGWLVARASREGR